MIERGPDPNLGSIDPIEPEYWKLGEDLQDAITASGYASPTVEGIAVDLHDLLQEADRIRSRWAPEAVVEPSDDRLDALAEALHHIAWHCQSAQEFITQAKSAR